MYLTLLSKFFNGSPYKFDFLGLLTRWLWETSDRV